MNNFNIYTYTSENIYAGPCECKKLGRLNVNDLHIHTIEMLYIQAIDTYTHTTGSNPPISLQVKLLLALCQ
jgi:hypothetical protein